MTNHRLHTRRGMSLAEMAFVLLVIGAVLAALWLCVGHIYNGWYVTQAEKQINILMQSVYQLRLTGRQVETQGVAMTAVPPNMLGVEDGKSVIYNPWHGRISVRAGNPGGWKTETSDNEYTISFDGVPSAACAMLVMRAQNMMSQGLIGIYVGATETEGRNVCFQSLSFCAKSVAPLAKSQAEHYCGLAGKMILMYAFVTTN